VNKNVTVPDGNSATPTPSSDGSGHASKPGKPDDGHQGARPAEPRHEQPSALRSLTRLSSITLT
jgi:hypothetical protein